MKLLLGHDAGVAAFVAGLIPGVAAHGFGKCKAIGVINHDGQLVGGMVFHHWWPEAATIEMSGAAITPAWLTPAILDQMFAYVFDQVNAQMLLTRNDAHNYRLHRQLASYGFDRFDIPRLFGRDRDGVFWTLTEETWRPGAITASSVPGPREGGLMSKPDAPAPPDPYKTAEAQTGQSVSTAIANSLLGQVNQNGPNGSLSYDQTGSFDWSDPTTGKVYKIPRFTATTSLSPTGQQINDNNQQSSINLSKLGAEQSGRLGDLLNRPMDTSGVPAAADRSVSRVPTYGATPGAPSYETVGATGDFTQVGAGPQYGRLTGTAGLEDTYQGADDFSGDRLRVEDALYARLNPQLDRQRETIQRELAGRGVRPGSAAYDRAMAEYGETANDARFGVIREGGAEQSRMTGLARDAATFTNTARQTEFGNKAAVTDQNNQATAAERADELGRIDTNNSLVTQALQNAMARAGFNNATGAQGFSDQMLRTGRDDANLDKTFGMGMQEMEGQDRARAIALQEKTQLRNQPLNELLAIMGGTQVQAPNFNIAQPSQMQTTDVAGLINTSFGQQQQNYAQQMAQYQAMMGGLFKLGDRAAQAAAGGAGGA